MHFSYSIDVGKWVNSSARNVRPDRCCDIVPMLMALAVASNDVIPYSRSRDSIAIDSRPIYLLWRPLSMCHVPLLLLRPVHRIPGFQFAPNDIQLDRFH